MTIKRIIKDAARVVPSSYETFDRNMWYNNNKAPPKLSEDSQSQA